MKDTNEMTCAAFGDVAAELALGTLSGDERARALSHIETCVECRRETARLADTVEELLVLAPRVEPSPGLEHAVLARIEEAKGDARAAGPGPRPRARRRTAGRVLALAAAVGLVVAALVVAIRPADHAPASRLADMRTESNQVVGSVVLTADPAAAVLDIPHWNALVDSYGAAADAPYWLSVRARDGGQESHALSAREAGRWHVGLDVDPGAVAAVSIVDEHGVVWCTAAFTRAA